MGNKGFLKILGAFFAASVLAACGGGASFNTGGSGTTTGGTTGGTGGGTTGGTTGSGIPQTVVLNASPSVITADGVSATSLTATLTDTTGAVLAGKTLNFTTTAGTLTKAAVPSDANGRATTQLVAGVKAGTVNVTVRESSTNISANTTVTFAPGPAKTVTISLAPSAVPPGGTTSANVNVTDASGNPVSGAIVNFGTTANNSGGRFTAPTATTDGFGNAVNTYQAGTATGTDTIAASTPSASANTAQANLAVDASRQTIGKVQLTLGSTTAVADGATATAVSAKVTDSAGNLVPANTTVNFTTTSGAFAGGGTSATGSTSGNTGIATVQLISPTQVGVATVTASSGGFSGTGQLSFVAGAPNLVTLSINPTTVVAGGATQLTATVVDSNGNAVPNVTVKFAVAPGTNASPNSGPAVTSFTAVTDANGTAAVTYRAGTSGGTDNLSASVAGVSTANQGSGTLTVTSSVSAMTLFTSAPQLLSSASSPAQGVTVTALLRDANNNVVSGQQVQFSAVRNVASSCGNGGVLQIVNGTTDSSGTAKAILFTGGDTTNQLIDVKATAAGKQAGPVTISETGTKLFITGPSAVGLGGNASYTISLVDAGNNPISNQGLTISSASNNPFTFVSGSQTSANGQVAIQYTGANGGGDVLTAQPSGCAASAAQAKQSVQVATQNLMILAPSANAQLPFGAVGTFVTGATVAAAGTGYVVGDVLALSGGTSTIGAQLKVTAVSGAGAITGISVVNGGAYSAVPASPASLSGGSGSGATVNLLQSVSVQLTGGTISGQTVTFATSRGTLSATSATTNAAGIASVSIHQDPAAGAAGGGVITATCTTCSPSISSSVNVQFNSITPATVSLQANPSNVPISGTSLITATVLDAFDNLVANQQVNFSLVDDSGGALLQSTGTTDSSGRVVINYQAGSTTSSLNGVQVTGTVSGISSVPTFYVASATPVNAGQGYKINDDLTVVGGSSTSAGAVAHLKVTSLGVTSVSLSNAGSYTVLPSSPAAVTGGSGSGATVNFTSTIKVSQASISAAGTGYAVNDVLTVVGGTSTSAAQISVNAVSGTGAITSASVLNGGSYSVPPTSPVSVTGGAGSGATFNLTTAKVVTGATVAGAGAGYLLGDTLTLSGGTSNIPAQFTVTAVGAIGTVNVTNAGGDYSSSPSNPASVTGGSGTGATFQLVNVKKGTVLLTVGGQSLRIVLGTGNTVVPLNNTQYQLPYSVLVTDSSGNPPPTGSVVSLAVNALAYQKGSEVYVNGSWAPIYAVNCGSDPGCATTSSFGCFNEDVNYNGVLDQGEDYNGNRELDPGNVTSLPASVTLDANGTGSFFVTYPKDRSYWVQVFVTASIKVNGNQSSTKAIFVLPGLSTDFNTQNVSPPGQISPYGTASTCANPN
ncbi:MAG: hypothetical protein E6R07_10335 [Nevskiaceae bacterium]|nr:MAG: hypothetical protein E6R07_10335 [Nevskiaceae bacterium]